MFSALNARPWLLLLCPTSSVHRNRPRLLCPPWSIFQLMCSFSEYLHRHAGAPPPHTQTHTNGCSLRPAAAFSLASVAASDCVCSTWGCSTPGDSLAVRKSCLLFIFTAAAQPNSGAFSSLLHFQKLVFACTCCFSGACFLWWLTPTGLFESWVVQTYT